ncbi:MAG: circadian clock KaiB family protein [Myxococcota bacterium]
MTSKERSSRGSVKKAGRSRAGGRAAGRGSRSVDKQVSDARKGGERYVLRLYIAGLTFRSQQAIEKVREICEENLKGKYDLEVIDIYQLPALAKGEQIVATPTLVRVLPAPLRRYIGDLSKEEFFRGLEILETAD